METNLTEISRANDYIKNCENQLNEFNLKNKKLEAELESAKEMYKAKSEKMAQKEKQNESTIKDMRH